ncbi:MAG TPA: hypothetical protein VLW53_15805 [Candidatus Eisenbacteria bacterium]|nr:hypothetical protein [Candidatus Eisenbacteria bacterium]
MTRLAGLAGCAFAPGCAAAVLPDEPDPALPPLDPVLPEPPVGSGTFGADEVTDGNGSGVVLTVGSGLVVRVGRGRGIESAVA